MTLFQVTYAIFYGNVNFRQMLIRITQYIILSDYCKMIKSRHVKFNYIDLNISKTNKNIYMRQHEGCSLMCPI